MNERFEGIVLFKRPYRERDALVKIFTSTYGTKMFFVKQAERANHPLTAQLIPLTWNHYVGDIHEVGLSFIREGQTAEMFREIQMDYLKQAYAVYITQLVDASVEDNEPNPPLYRLLHQALNALNKGQSPEIVAIYMEIQLLAQFGTQIDWQHCVECKETKLQNDFSIVRQGLLCNAHWHLDQHRLRISPRAMHIASTLAKISLTQLQTVNISEQTIAELRRLMDELYQEYVGIRLKSKSYLNQLRNMQQLMKRPPTEQ
ncbi:DNA repair protein RecO [Aerococcaceae bacterium NML190073]|nr:DNA repair protein RecO [Aerococcaceae bacterium NML190073]MDO4775610.1 DNA repair protein RecO [Aerococcaceae bacterium]